MRKEVIKLYKFQELSKEVQEKVIKEMQEDEELLPDGWYEWIFATFKENMYRKYGCNVDDIYFSGFYSQGDGASFTGNIYIKDYLEKTKQKSKYRSLFKYLEEYGPNVDIRHSGYYYHSETMDFNDNYFYEGTEEQQDQLYNIMDEIEKVMKEEANNLYKALQNEYEDRTSKEEVEDILINNDCEFYEDGEVYNF